MAILDFFRTKNYSLKSKSISEKPRTLKEAIGRLTPQYGFNAEVKDKENEWTVPHLDKNFKLYEDIYTSIPVAKNAVDNLSNFAIQSGYELDGGSVTTIEKFVDTHNFEQLMLNVLRQMIIYGNAYLELDVKGAEISSMKLLPPSQMYVVVAKGGGNDGQLIKYRQVLGTQKQIDFKLEQIAHFKWNEIGPAFYGYSDLKAIQGALTSLLNYQADLGEVVHRYGHPTMHHKLGTDDSPASGPQIEEYIDMIEGREPGQDIITSTAVELKSISSDLRMVQPDGLIKHMENQLIAGLGVPEIFIRGGETSNKATADIELQAFDRKVKALRNAMTEVIHDKIFSVYGDTKIKWREMSIQEEGVKGEMVKNLNQAGVPPEVAFKIVGWDNFINDLMDSENYPPPEPTIGFGGPPGMGPPKPNGKPKPPKEDAFDTQADWLKAMVKYNRINDGL